jgi:hypothetical protein
LLDFDVLAIEEDREHVWVDGSGVDELELLDEARGDDVELFGTGAETHLFERGFCSIYRAGGREHAEEKGLYLIGVSSLVGRRDRRRSEIAGAGSGHPNVDGDGANIHRAPVAAVAFIAVGLGEVGAAFGLPGGGEHHSEELANTEVLQAGGEQTVDLLVERLGEGVL